MFVETLFYDLNMFFSNFWNRGKWKWKRKFVEQIFNFNKFSFDKFPIWIYALLSYCWQHKHLSDIIRSFSNFLTNLIGDRQIWNFTWLKPNYLVPHLLVTLALSRWFWYRKSLNISPNKVYQIFTLSTWN